MAKLTAGERKKAPQSDFALPGKQYYIGDAEHARMALSMGSKNASPAELATIKRKVHARYPNIEIS